MSGDQPSRADSLRARTGLRLVAALALAVVALTALTGCGAPSYRFVVSDSKDVVVKVPRTWTVVRSGPPPVGADGTAPSGVPWLGVFDAASRPSIAHVRDASVDQPVALAQTWVITKEQGATVTDDDLRDVAQPFTEAGRQQALQAGNAYISTFAVLENTVLSTRHAHGVRVVYSYDLGEGVEVFTKVALIDKAKTHVHAMYIHCSKACWEKNKQDIADTAHSFTVKVP